MKGRIKNYNEQKGFGFILGNDNQDYFFHISDVNTFEPLKRGDFVNFIVSENKKGKCAKQVEVHSNQKAKFVQIEDVCLKVSNIKNYGISDSRLLIHPSCFYEVTLKEKEYSILDKVGMVAIGIVGIAATVAINTLLGDNTVFENNTDDVNSSDCGERVSLIYLDDYSEFGEAPPYSKGQILNNKWEVVNCRLIEGEYYYRIITENDYFIEKPNNKGHFKSGLPYCKGDKYGVYEEEVVSCELVKNEPYEYLYVTTYQGDNYKFYDNIEENKNKLDDLLK